MQLVPPEVKETPEAPIEAAARLEKMGPMSTDEKLMLVTMALAVTLWVGVELQLGSHPVVWYCGSSRQTTSRCKVSYATRGIPAAWLSWIDPLRVPCVHPCRWLAHQSVCLLCWQP